MESSDQNRFMEVEEAEPKVCSARSSVDLNSNRLSILLEFRANMSSTPIKLPEDKSHSFSVNDQKENIAVKIDENQNYHENTANRPSTVLSLSNMAVSPIVSNPVPSNLSQPFDSATDLAAERNPFFCHDQSGAIVCMNLSSPPLECLDRMMNLFNYNPNRPKITGYTKLPRKVKPLFDRSLSTEPALSVLTCTSGAESGRGMDINESKPFGKTVSQISTEAAFATANSTLYYSVPSNNRASTSASSALPTPSEVGQKNVLCKPLSSNAKKSLATIVEDGVRSPMNCSRDETQKIESVTLQHCTQNSSVLESVPWLLQSGVLDANAGIQDVSQTSSVLENIPSLFQSGVADGNVHHVTENSSVIENVPSLFQSGVTDGNVHHVTENSSVMEKSPSLFQSGVTDGNVHHVTENSSVIENVPSLFQSEVTDGNFHRVMENSSVIGNDPSLFQSGVTDGNVHHVTENSSVMENVPSLFQSEVSDSNIHFASENSPIARNISVLRQSGVPKTSACRNSQDTASAENLLHFFGPISPVTNVLSSTPNPFTQENIPTPLQPGVSFATPLEDLFSSPSEVFSQLTPGVLDEELNDSSPAVAMWTENFDHLLETGDSAEVPQSNSTMMDVAAPSTSTAAVVANANGLSKIPKIAQRKSRRLSVRLAKPQVVCAKTSAFGKTQTNDSQRHTGCSLRRSLNKTTTQGGALTKTTDQPLKLSHSTNRSKLSTERQKLGKVHQNLNLRSPKASTVTQRSSVKETTRQNSSILRSRLSTVTASGSRHSVASKIGATTQTKPSLLHPSTATPQTSTSALKTSKLSNIRLNFQRQLAAATNSSGMRSNLRQSTVTSKTTGIVSNVQHRQSIAPSQNSTTVTKRSGLRPPSTVSLRQSTLAHKAGLTTQQMSLGPSTSKLASQSIASTSKNSSANRDVVRTPSTTKLRQSMMTTAKNSANRYVLRAPSTTRLRQSMMPTAKNSASRDVLKASTSGLQDRARMVSKLPAKKCNETTSASSSEPTSSETKSEVTVTDPTAGAQTLGDLVPSASELATNPTAELLAIMEEDL